MGQLKKIVAFLLSVVLLLQYMPIHTVNATTVNEMETAQVSEVAKDAMYDGVYIEDVELKGHTKRLKEKEDLNTYVFENADGTNTLYMMDENVKYKTASGKVKDKNINLKKIYGGYSVSDNEYSLQIPNGIKEGISFGYKESQIRLVPQDIDSSNDIKNVELKNNAITYKNIYGEGIDLRYTPLLDGVKEDIILSEYTQKNSFEFILYSDGKDIYNDNGRYYLADTVEATDKIYLGNVIVYDAVGRPEEGELKVEVIKKAESYKITIKVSDEYLSDDLTVYPVTIDPTFTISDNVCGNNTIEDCPVYSGRPDNNHGTYYFNRVGKVNDGYGTGRTVMRFNLDGIKLSENPDVYYESLKMKDIISAKLYLKEGSGTTSRDIEMYAIPTNKPWTESNLTWKMVPSDTIDAGNYIITTALPSNAKVSFDITSYLQMCKKGVLSLSNGVLLKDANEENAINKSFISAEYTTSSYRPYIELTYDTNINRSDGTYFIRNIGTQKCLALIPDDEEGNDTLGQLDYRSNDGSIRWSLVSIGNDYYYIKRGSNVYLGASTSDNSVTLYMSSTAPSSSAYIWKLKRTTDGNLKIVSKAYENYNNGLGKVLMISGNNVCCAGYSDNENYTDEWRVDAYISVSGSPASYVPNNWTFNPTSGEDGFMANCYTYALNIKLPDLSNINPGTFSNQTFKNYQISGQLIEDYVRDDFVAKGLNDSEEIKSTDYFKEIGKFETCETGYYKVALVVNTGRDYHWYRQNSDGTWSSKHGQNGDVDCTYGNGDTMIVLDPEYSGRTNNVGYNYHTFVKFFSIKPLGTGGIYDD